MTVGPARFPSPRAGRRAYSLIELIVVVAIVSLLASMAIPRFANSLVRRRVEAAARRVQSDLGLVQRRARTGSAALTVQFDTAAAAYTVPGLPDPDHPKSTYRVALGEAPYEVGFRKVDLGGTANITYDGYGQPSCGGTIVVRAGLTEIELTVDATTGEVKIP